jgi:hypothetical protein
MACPPRGTQRTHSTPSRDDGVEQISSSLRAPRVARTPQTQPGGQQAEAYGAKGAWQEVTLARSNACGARATGLVSAPRSALRRPPGRLRRSQAVGGRKPTATLADCRLRRSRVQTGWHRRKNLRRTHARARAAALVRSCVGATRRRSRAIPPAAPTLDRDRPNSPFGVRAGRRGWASALRAGERASTMTSPPLDQNVRARAPPRALPAMHLTNHGRMAAKAPRGAIGIL